MAYLDKDGVRKLWAKVKALFNKGVTDISINGKTVTITKGDGSTSTQTTKDTEYSVFRGATNSADGSNGLVPAPKSGKQDSFLKGDGTWGTPENTKYNVVSKTAAGLAPQLPNETSTTKYLRQDGTWAVPPNQTYNKATQSSDGLMAKEDKTKLDRCLREWMEYKDGKQPKAQHHYGTEIGIKKLITSFYKAYTEYGIAKVIQVVDYSISNNYSGVIWNKLKEQNSNNSYMDAVRDRVSMVDDWV